jgi:predicted PilT family ATPase
MDAKIQIPVQGDADNPDVRTVIITHPNGEQAANEAKQMIQDVLARGQSGKAMKLALVRVRVLDADVGLIVGKAGATIKSIEGQMGTHVTIPFQGDADNPNVRTVTITHPRCEEAAKEAKQMIQDVLAKTKSRITMHFEVCVSVCMHVHGMRIIFCCCIMLMLLCCVIVLFCHSVFGLSCCAIGSP